MKTPNDYPQVKFRPGKELVQTLASRSPEQTDSSYSRTAKQDLADYYTLLSLCLPDLNEIERSILYQALNGWQATPETVHLLWAEVATISDDHTLVARLRQLSRFECWSLVIAARCSTLCPDQ